MDAQNFFKNRHFNVFSIMTCKNLPSSPLSNHDAAFFNVKGTGHVTFNFSFAHVSMCFHETIYQETVMESINAPISTPWFRFFFYSFLFIQLGMQTGRLNFWTNIDELISCGFSCELSFHNKNDWETLIIIMLIVQCALYCSNVKFQKKCECWHYGKG